MIKEITSFETTDGKLFTNLQAATRHQAEIEILRLCYDVCRMGCGGEWTADMIADAIIEHAKEFETALNEISEKDE